MVGVLFQPSIDEADVLATGFTVREITPQVTRDQGSHEDHGGSRWRYGDLMVINGALMVILWCFNGALMWINGDFKMKIWYSYGHLSVISTNDQPHL